IVSRAAPIIAVSALSRELGIMISPVVFPALVSDLTSILPILPDLCSSLNSNSFPNKPSVWPNIAPMTSGLSTTPSIEIWAWIMYLATTGLIFPILSSQEQANYGFIYYYIITLRFFSIFKVKIDSFVKMITILVLFLFIMLFILIVVARDTNSQIHCCRHWLTPLSILMAGSILS